MRTLISIFLSSQNKKIVFVAFLLFGLSCGKSSRSSAERICSGESDLRCPRNEYCKFEDFSCGDGGETGICTPQPDACFLLFSPVCGCDGKTYPNDCEAAAAGVSVRKDGECS